MTPAAEQTKVMHPINDTAGIILTLRNASDTPTASASILVAIASKNILLTPISSLTFSSSPNDSLIILPPINKRSINAIQCEYLVIISAKKLPR